MHERLACRRTFVANTAMVPFGYLTTRSWPVLRTDDNRGVAHLRHQLRAIRQVGRKSPDEVRGEDPRFYVSIAPYYWPDDRGGWKVRDGYTSPATKTFKDQANFYAFMELLRSMAYAALTTDDHGYVDLYEESIEYWFLDEAHGMYPTFRYSQIAPGRREIGSPYGLLAARHLYTLGSSSICLAEKFDVPSRLVAPLSRWLWAYRDESYQTGLIDHLLRTSNNHLTWYVAHQMMICLLLGDMETFARLESLADEALGQQAGPDGRPEKEIHRTTSLAHAILNACGWIAILSMTAFARQGWDDAVRRWPAALDLISFVERGAARPGDWAWQQLKPVRPERSAAFLQAAGSIRSCIGHKGAPLAQLLSVSGLI